MRRILVLILLLTLYCTGSKAATYTVDRVPNVHVADSSAYVADPDGILTSSERLRINELMRQVRRQTSAEPMFVIVGNIEPQDIDGFATDLFTKWGLGKSDKDNGLLVLVAKDMKRASVRTGYGLEGVMPDIVCAGILRNRMFPAFRRGDYGGGMVAGAEAVHAILSDSDAAAEFRSGEKDADFARGRGGDGDFFRTYLLLACILAAVMLLFFLYLFFSSRGKSPQERYMALQKYKPVYLALTFFGLGIPLVAALPLLLTLRRLRNMPHRCPNCGAKMQKIDEVHDNEFLTSSQDFEERIGSVDYDVWHCPRCGEVDVEQYVASSSGYRQCPACHAYAQRLARQRIVVQPTTARKGQGVRDYVCAHCGHVDMLPYEIPMLVAPPVIIGGGGGGGSHFGGGGGGFGGGMTGGGGASDGW